MKKHLKIFLTVIVSIFSSIFIGNVKAYQYYNVDLNEEFFNNGWEVLEGKTMKSITGSGTTKILHKDDFSYSICSGVVNANSDIEIKCTFLTDISFKSKDDDAIYYNSNTRSLYTYAPAFQYNINNKTYSATWDFGTWFYDYYPVSFDLYDSNNNQVVTKKFDYPPINNYPHTFNFHLNGGWVYDSRDGWGSNEDFSFTLYPNEVEDFIVNLEVKKYLMLFEGWYYDSGFTQPFTLNDHITSDVDLYAKFRYERVDDFLANTPLNKHTFDEHYNYAIINRGDNGDSVYIGLPFEAYNLEVYEFNESEYKVKDGASACPTPLYSKNGYYYYDINTLFTNNQEVLILPRTLFDELDPNNFENPNDIYNFYLSNNGYVSYTNDLSQAQIINSSGEQISINLQDSYELSQQYQELYSKPENIFEQMNIFLDKMKKITSAVKDIIGYLFNSLNSTLKSFITFLVVLILITAIIRFARRG